MGNEDDEDDEDNDDNDDVTTSCNRRRNLAQDKSRVDHVPGRGLISASNGNPRQPNQIDASCHPLETEVPP